MKLTAYFQQLFFILLLVACLTNSQEVDDESEFSYDETSATGPAHWGEIRPEWANCSAGKRQSPINLVNQKVQIVSNLGPINTRYTPATATLVNRGHDVKLGWSSGAGYFQIKGIKYELKQCHWHSPSEHYINGKRLDLELHLVHQTKSNRTAVIAILYKIGQPDSFLSMIQENLEAVISTKDIEESLGMMSPTLIKFDTKSYYRYTGSLTTPPCTESVTWTVVKKVRTVSKAQLQLLRSAVHDGSEVNARPLQALNGRKVTLYEPAYVDDFVDYLEMPTSSSKSSY